MARPAALGTVVVITSLADVDLVLAELSYLRFRSNEVVGEVNQQIDAIKTAALEKTFVTVEGQRVTIKDRMESLLDVLAGWIPGNIEQHAEKGKKSIDLAHGTIGMRQQQLAIEFAETKTAKDVIDAFDAVSVKTKRSVFGWVAGTLARLSDIVKGYGPVSDFIRLKLELNMVGIKAAYKGQRVKKEQLAALHLVPIDPVDVPYADPAEYVVTAE